ncbi:MAG: hypothetical protein ACRYG2_36520, partial [Janthinobacterium lividum]
MMIMVDAGATTRTAGATYQDLCVDVTDLDAAAALLGPLLGLQPEERREHVLRLGDGVPAHTVWLNLVGEER